MKKIMIFIGSYLPGTKSAGVMTSISNMVDRLSEHYDFYIVTADRDIGAQEPYNTVPLECWTKYGTANVYYSAEYMKSFTKLKEIINSVVPDVYYCNSFYNKQDTLRVLFLYLLKMIPQKPIVMAPRGIFSMGKFETHSKMRAVVRNAVKASGLISKMKWHATAELEEKDILKYFPKVKKNITIVPNISGITVREKLAKIDKAEGILKIIFLSRVSEKKNIKYVIECLANIKGNIQFDVYGMIGTSDDQKYWDECVELSKSLPESIVVNYRGEISHDLVGETFGKYHLFFFPTFGENYGHVIAESLANGCPVLLSDMTPWNTLEKYHAGWSIPLSEKERFIEIVQILAQMSYAEWQQYAEGALSAAKELIDENIAVQKYIDFFDGL